MDYYVKTNYKHSEITGQIIGCAMRVHSEPGPGFPEIIYHRALEIEFQEQNISYDSEREIEVYYHNKLIGKRRPDFLVEKKVMVEIKAIKKLEDSDISQSLNYLKAYNLDIGLLINFGSKSLEYKRLIRNDNAKEKSKKSFEPDKISN